MKSNVRAIARSAVSNWLSMFATLAVGFFLAPFVVHRLGNVAYGVWVLAVSSVNYLTLLDLGMRSSVLRYVSKGHATKDHTAASDVLSAAFWVRLQISGLVLVASVALAGIFPLIFKVPQGLEHEARIAILIIGITTALTMSIGVVGGVLSALNRYDLQAVVTVTQLIIRVVGVVSVLLTGHSIVAIAFCELGAAAVGNLLLLYISHRIYPELKLRLTKPRREILRQIWSYSIYAFLITIAIQLVYQTDNLVVGAFVSATAVTFYSIGNSLCRYADQLVGAMTGTFLPVASSYDAGGDTAGLRSLYFHGTRATLALSLPVIVTLLIRGRTFIGLWMGAQYVKPSGTVLIILAIAFLFTFPNHAAGAIAFGVEKHKTIAYWAIGEACVNLTLSAILAHRIGMYGVALGTLIPSFIVQFFMWPRYVTRLVDVTTTEVYFRVWGPMYLAAVPFGFVSYAIDRFLPPHNMMIFFLEVLAACPVFLIAIVLMFPNAIKREVIPRLRSALQPILKTSS